MKKKQEKQSKLSLNKFKVTRISNFGKGKIFGGDGNDDDNTVTNTEIRSKGPRCVGNTMKYKIN